jgi:tetratricopeptide (TPR) repeat protein
MIRCYKCGNEFPEEYRFCPLDATPFYPVEPEEEVQREPVPVLEEPEHSQIRVRTLLIGLAVLVCAGALTFAGAFFYLYLKPKFGGFEVKTTPPDALVYLDGKQVGVSPLTLQNLRSGGHQIRIVKEGYRELVQTVQVIPYSTESQHWSLEPLVPQLSNEQLAEVEELKKRMEGALKEKILLPPPDDYNVLYLATKILAIDPANSYATGAKNKLAEELQQKADAAYAREDWLEAEKQYKNLALVFPDDVSVNQRLSDISQKIDESVKDRERRVQEWTAKVEAAFKADSLVPPDKDNALDAIRSIQRLDRRNAYAREAMARLREALQTRADGRMNSGDWLGARNQLRLILQYFPDDPYSKSRLVQAEAKLAEAARADQERLAHQQEEQRSKQETDNLHRAALSAYHSGDYAKSLSLWQEYLKRQPNTAEAYFYLGAIYLEQKQLDTAILNFERCVSLTPDNALAHLNLGILYDRHRNDLNRALEHLKKVLDLGGVDKYTPDKLRPMIQDLQDRIDLTSLEKKVFPVVHKHTFSSCRGYFRVSSQGVEYRTTETDHSFYEGWNKVRTWAVEGDEISLRLENNKKYNLILLNSGDASLVLRLMTRWAAAVR